MAQIVQLKRNSVTGQIPTTSSLVMGELAMNTYDGRIFYKRSGSVIAIESLLSPSINSSYPIWNTGSLYLSGSGIVIEGANTNLALKIKGSNTQGSGVGIQLENNYSTGKTYQIVSYDDGTFVLRDTSGNNFFYFSGSLSLVKDGGNVVIGGISNTSNSKLKVSGSAEFTSNVVIFGSLTTNIISTLLKTTSGGVITSSIAGVDYIAGGVGTTNYLPKFSGSGVLTNSGIYDNGTGVGVGTSVPLAPLHVKVTSSGITTNPLGSVGIIESSGDAYISIYSPTSREKGLIFGDNTSEYTGGIFYNSSGVTNGLNFRVNGNNTKLVITSAGNVGVNNSSPSYSLDVSGTGRFTGALTLTTPLSVSSGGTGTGSFYSSSLLIGNGTGSLIHSSNLIWDNVNGYLGINKNGGQLYSAIDVNGNIRIRKGDALWMPDSNDSIRVDDAPSWYSGNSNVFTFLGYAGTWIFRTSDSLRNVMIIDSNISNVLKVSGSISSSVDFYFGTTSVSASLALKNPLLSGSGFLKLTLGVPSYVTGSSVQFVKGDGTLDSSTIISGSGISNYIAKWNGNYLTSSLIYDDGTNVGVGTTSPLRKFHVEIGSNTYAFRIGVGGTNSIEMGNEGAAGNSVISFQGTNFFMGGNGGKGLGIGAGVVNANVPTTSSYTNIVGSLGINQSAPSYSLDVTGAGRFTSALKVDSTTASTSRSTGALIVSGGLGVGGAGYFGGSIIITGSGGYYAPNNTAFSFRNAANSAYLRAFTLASDDNLKIGEDSNISYILSNYIGLGTSAIWSKVTIGGGNVTLLNNIDIQGVVAANNTFLPIIKLNISDQVSIASGGAVTIFGGKVGLGVTATSVLHIKAGTAAANTAPIKLTAGTNLTSPESGSIEFDGTDLFFTPSSTRRTFAFLNGNQTFSGVTTFSNTTTSTSTTTGALTVAGGLGIVGTSYFGNTINSATSTSKKLSLNSTGSEQFLIANNFLRLQYDNGSATGWQGAGGGFEVGMNDAATVFFQMYNRTSNAPIASSWLTSGIIVNDNSGGGITPSSTQLLTARTYTTTKVPFTVIGATSQSADLLQIQNASSIALAVFNKDGYLGLGTTIPTHSLSFGMSGYSDTKTIAWQNSSSTNRAAYIQAVGIGNYTHYLAFGVNTTTADVNAVEVMRIGTDGTVAVGTTTTGGAKFTIANTGSGEVGLLLLKNSGANGDSGKIIFGTTAGGANGAEIVSKRTAGDFSVDLFFRTTDSGGIQNEVLRMTSTKYVGINNSSPSYTLDVSGSVRIPNNTSIYGNNISGTPVSLISINTNNRIVLSQTGYTVTFSNLLFSDNSTEARIQAGNSGGIRFMASNASDLGKMFENGNYSWGSIVDSGYKFDVSGSTRITSTLSVTGSVFLSGIGNVTSGSINILISSGSDYKVNALSSSQFISNLGIVSGSGTARYYSVFSSSGVIGNGGMYDNGVGSGVVSMDYNILYLGNTATNNTLNVNRTGASPSSISVTAGVANPSITFVSGYGLGGRLSIGSASLEIMSFWGDGNVSINNASNAGYKLDVSGSGRYIGDLFISSSTASTSVTTGALTIRGGLGVSGSIYGGTTLSIISSGSASVNGGIYVGTGATFASNADNLLTVRGTGNSASSWKGRITAGGDNYAFLMGEFNSHAWLGGHNAALNAWADLYINPEASGAKKVFIGAVSARENAILTIDNATGYSTFSGSVYASVGAIYAKAGVNLTSTSSYTFDGYANYGHYLDLNSGYIQFVGNGTKIGGFYTGATKGFGFNNSSILAWNGASETAPDISIERVATNTISVGTALGGSNNGTLSAGMIGVATISPSYSLDVSGSGRFTGNLIISGGLTGSLFGNASTATVLQSARTINGTLFDGSANITISISGSALLGTTLASNIVSSSLTTLGTIGTGLWNATKISEVYGGTNQSTYTVGDMLYSSGSNTLNKLAIGSSAQMLIVNSGIPSWQTVSGDITITNAGVTAIGSSKVTNTMLSGSIASSKLIGTDITTIGTITSGTLGTGAVIAGVTITLGSDASYDLHYRNSSGILTRLANGTTGQVLTSTTNAAPSWALANAGLLTGFASAAGTLSASDTILQAISKLDGNLNAQSITAYTATGSNSYTMPTGAKSFIIVCVGAGGGGGSGRKDANNTNRYGGGGGGSGAISIVHIRATDVSGSTLTCSVGAGGGGGAARSTSVDGATGTAGGDTTVTNNSVTICKASGGSGGIGGTSAAGTGGAGGTVGDFVGLSGGSSSVSGTAGAGTSSVNKVAGGGGAGGGSDSSENWRNGGAGGSGYFGLITGGTGGVAATSSGTNGTAPSNAQLVGSGGGGGTLGSGTTTGKNGARGAGAGGGSAGNATTNSGAGGTGGNGYVLIFAYF